MQGRADSRSGWLFRPDTETFDSSLVGFLDLLGKIQEHKIDVTWCPLTEDPSLSNIADWYVDQASYEDLSDDQTALVTRCREHLGVSIERSAMKPINIRNIEGMVTREIITDLKDMQRCAPIYEEYRRFVMIVGKGEAQSVIAKGCYGVCVDYCCRREKIIIYMFA